MQRAATRVAGVEAVGSPSAQPPAIPSNKIPICQVQLTSGDTAILDRHITDERAKYRNLVDGADFDGTNDYMLRGGALTGAPAAAATGILFACLRVDGGDGARRRFLNGISGGALNGPRFSWDLSNRLQMTLTGGSGVWSIQSNLTYAAGAAYRTVLASWDLSQPTSAESFIYIDDASDKGTETTYTSGTVDWSAPDNWAVSAENTTTFTSKWNGALAELYLAPGQYLDFSIEANRRKFIRADGKPVFLGHDGSRPTGVAPLIYQRLRKGEAVANFATNRGTGGDFTITGTLDTASTSPSD